jgi:hypothetical protein
MARCLIEPEAFCRFPAVPDEEDEECDSDFEVFIEKCEVLTQFSLSKRHIDE